MKQNICELDTMIFFREALEAHEFMLLPVMASAVVECRTADKELKTLNEDGEIGLARLFSIWANMMCAPGAATIVGCRPITMLSEILAQVHAYLTVHPLYDPEGLALYVELHHMMDAILSSRVKPHNEKVYYIIDNIQTAIGNHQQIRFQYYEYTQEKKKILKHDGYYYVVNPYALEWKNDHYYLIGFSLKHQKIAHFRVDRLTGVETLETCFIPIEGFDVASYTNKMVDMFTSESSKEVTLVCESELMRVIIDHYGEDVPVEKYDDGHFTARIEVNPSGTFYGWIFKFKGKIKILSPKECITEMQQIAHEFI